MHFESVFILLWVTDKPPSRSINRLALDTFTGSFYCVPRRSLLVFSSVTGRLTFGLSGSWRKDEASGFTEMLFSGPHSAVFASGDAGLY